MAGDRKGELDRPEVYARITSFARGRRPVEVDSMAWSFEARRHDPLPGCTGHKNCANCLAYALTWRERVVSIPEPPQLDLFGGVA